MRKRIIELVLLTLFCFIAQNVIFAQVIPPATKRYEELKTLSKNFQWKINEACDKLQEGIRVDIGGFSTLAIDWRMKGWSVDNWVKNGYIWEELKSDRGYYWYNYYPTQKLCDEKETIFNYLDRQVNLFPMFEDWGIYNWYSKDSLQARANQLDSFLKFLKSGALIIKLWGKGLEYPETFRSENVDYMNIDGYFQPTIIHELSLYNFQKIDENYKSKKYKPSVTSTCIEITTSEAERTYRRFHFTPDYYATILLKLTPKAKQLIREGYSGFTTGVESFLKSYNQGKSMANATWESMSGLSYNGRKMIEDVETTLINKHKELKERSGHLRVQANNLLMVLLSVNSDCNSATTQEQIKDIINKINEEASSTAEFVEKQYIPALENIKLRISLPTVTVATTEVSIAVKPPIIFSEEHTGTSSFEKITPEGIFNEIKKFLFTIAPTVFMLLMIVGAIFYLLAPINVQNIRTGSEYIKWAIVGYFVLLVITGILTAVKTIFGGP